MAGNLQYFVDPNDIQKQFFTTSVQHYNTIFGKGMPHFYGSYAQRGQGIFSDLMRKYAMPALAKVTPHVLHGVRKVIKDISRGRPIKKSIKTRGISTIKKAAKTVLGGRVTKRRRRRKIKRKPRKARTARRKRQTKKRRVVKRRGKKTKFPLFN